MKDLLKYKCHNAVGAFLIVTMEPGDDGRVRLTGSPSRLCAQVDACYMLKHTPKVGGYYVLYEGGYESWSPAQEFEDGYTDISIPTAY